MTDLMMNDDIEQVNNQHNNPSESNVTEETEKSNKTGRFYRLKGNLAKNKKHFFIMTAFLLVAAFLGHYIVGMISDKQGDNANVVGGISSSAPLGIEFVKDGNLIEKEKLTNLIFDNVKKDERSSVKSAKSSGVSFIAKVVAKEPLIASLPKTNKQIKKKSKSIASFDKTNSTVKPPANKRKETLSYQAQQTPSVQTNTNHDVLQSKLIEYQNLLKTIVEPSGKEAGYYDFTEVDNNPNSIVNNKNPDPSIKNLNPKNNAKKDIYVGDVLYARLAFNLNTDFKTDVIAHVVSDNQLSDATLIGAMEHNAQFDKMVLTFNSIDINGTIKPFKAIAIDIDSDLAGVADDVDNHYFQRLVLPVLLGSMGSAADVYINQGIKTTTPSSSDDVVSKTYEGGDKQVIAGLLTGDVDILKTIFLKKSNRPITVFKSKKRLLKIIALSSI